MSDLISRQAAIELVRDVCTAIMSGCDSYYDSETDDEVYKDLLEVDAILKCNKEIRIALRNMPSAQPKTKKGKWILKKELVPLAYDTDPLDWDNYDEDTHSEWKEFYHCSEL